MIHCKENYYQIVGDVRTCVVPVRSCRGLEVRNRRKRQDKGKDPAKNGNRGNAFMIYDGGNVSSDSFFQSLGFETFEALSKPRAKREAA